METCLLDHVKAQMVKADFYQMSSDASSVQKSHVCTEKLHLFNCKYDKADLFHLYAFYFSSTDRQPRSKSVQDGKLLLK